MRNAKPLKAVLALLALACCAWAASDGLPFTAEQLNHWAYQKVEKPKTPVVRDREGAKSPLAPSARAKLESEGVNPAPAADKITLLRRATFDLTGLPPTPEEVNSYLADDSPGAFEKVVDRLLDS